MVKNLKSFADRLLLVGCGNMAGAMLARWLDAGLDPALVAVIDPAEPALAPGIGHWSTIADWAASGVGADWVMIATKPQQFAEVAAALADHIRPDVAILSIMAGVALADIDAALPGAAAYVRFMPSLPVRVGAGVTVVAANPAAAADRPAVAALAAPLGPVVRLDDERQMDLITAFTGSGPAFVLRLIEAYAAAGERLGLDADQALILANATFGGTSALLASEHITPAEWVARVASKGGMTQVGLDMLDGDGQVAKLFTDVLRATRDRGRDLADAARG